MTKRGKGTAERRTKEKGRGKKHRTCTNTRQRPHGEGGENGKSGGSSAQLTATTHPKQKRNTTAAQRH